MSRYFITRLALGLLSISAVNAAAAAGINTNILSIEAASPASPSISISTLTIQAAAELKLFQTQSTIKEMRSKERKDLVNRLSSKRTALETVIPRERQAEATIQSCCSVFWKSCFRISSKTLGSLALDLIMDLSDGKLDGKGPDGSIDYIHHIVEIVNATIEEAKSVVGR